MSLLAQRLGGRRPRLLITLGSGLGALAEEVADALVFDFGELGLPEPTVPGHSGRLVAGWLGGTEVLLQQGRLHLYEGVAPQDVTAVVRAAADVGVEAFAVTNAAGGLRDDLVPGDVLCLSDHLNLTGTSPLIGRAPPTFVDLARAYDADLRRVVRRAAEAHGLPLREGVYAGLVGPAYETPAEVAMLRALGADAVGMSTVLEVVEARACGLRTVGLSLVTNVHRRGGTPTDHAEVLDVGRAAGPRIAPLLRALAAHLATRPVPPDTLHASSSGEDS